MAELYFPAVGWISNLKSEINNLRSKKRSLRLAQEALGEAPGVGRTSEFDYFGGA